MVERIVEFLMPYFSLYGYYLVFFGVMLENSALLGLVVPGETLLIIAAFYAAQNNLQIEYVIAVAFVGAVIGDNLGYWIGRRGGRAFLEKYGRWVFISERRIQAVQRYYQKHGGKTVLIARFTAFLRALAAITAGISHMEYRLFFLYDLAGAVVWAIGISLLGYFFGQNWRLLDTLINRIGWGIFILLVVIIVGAVVYRRRRRLTQVD